MKTVKVTIKLEFETDETDTDSIKDAVYSLLYDKIDSDELMEEVKVKIVDDEDQDNFDRDDEDEE